MGHRHSPLKSQTITSNVAIFFNQGYVFDNSGGWIRANLNLGTTKSIVVTQKDLGQLASL
jgi:hypothetical protein